MWGMRLFKLGWQSGFNFHCPRCLDLENTKFKHLNILLLLPYVKMMLLYLIEW
jgi:hypothetical protein